MTDAETGQRKPQELFILQWVNSKVIAGYAWDRDLALLHCPLSTDPRVDWCRPVLFREVMEDEE